MKRPIAAAFMSWMGVFFVVAVAVLWVTAQPQAEAVSAAADSGKRTIVVDAGQGGADGGTTGAKTGVLEAELNLSVARLVESNLKAAGFRVVMTRENEKMLGGSKKEDMQTRARIMSGEDVDLVVSVHMNSFRDRSVHGPMVFYMQGSTEGERLAAAVCGAVCDAIGHPRRLASPGDYFVLRQGSAPAVLVECGFLSNAGDEQKLMDPVHQRKLADGIAAGISAYFG
jgi:N-acetylmuramoyl-L-alanine amidase